MDLFGQMEMVWTISRELMYLKPPTSQPTPPVQGGQYNCTSLEELFDTFEKLYKRDKMAFEKLKHTPGLHNYADESKHPGEYTFTFRDRMLCVRIDNFDRIANKLFGFEEDDKHEG